MSSVKTIVRYSSCLFVLALLLGAAVTAFGDSRDINNPTLITSFPVAGNLGSGTFYYRIPEAMVSAGRANLVLDMNSPDGGASMTVTLSGRRCCPPEAYLGITTGLSDRFREATSFEVPGQQDLLVTVYISVGAKQTVSYRINFNLGAPTSGIVVTPPRPTLTPTTPTVCTDLAVQYYRVAGVGLTKEITGEVRNRTTTHPYKGFSRGQWIEIFDITDSEKNPPRVTFVRLPNIIDPGDSFSYRVPHTTTVLRRTRYLIKIVYSPNHAADRSEYNDDCNTANNTTRRQLIGDFPEDEAIEIETLPKARP